MKQIDYMPMLQDMSADINSHFALTQDRTGVTIVLLMIVIACIAWMLARLGAIKGKIDTQDARMEMDRKVFEDMSNKTSEQNRLLDRIAHLLEKN